MVKLYHLITDPAQELLQLKKDTAFSRSKAYADGTFKNLNTQWVKYLSFCSHFDLVALPASTAVLSWYAQFLSRTHKSHKSIVGYLSGVKTLHLLLNHPVKAFAGFLFKLTMRGLRRINQHAEKRAKPITPALLRKVYQQLNVHNDPLHAVFWATSLLAFFLLFRKSNLVPDTANGFNPERQLKHQDVIITQSNAVVGIRWSKNQQFSRELLTFPLPRLSGSVLCPVSAINNMKQLVPSDPSDHLFMLPGGNSLTYKKFQDLLRESLKKAGVVDYSAYSSHSYRRGGCTFSFLCGIPSPVIKLLGSWRSDCYLKYIEFPLETRTAATELMKLRIVAWERHQQTSTSHPEL